MCPLSDIPITQKIDAIRQQLPQKNSELPKERRNQAKSKSDRDEESRRGSQKAEEDNSQPTKAKHYNKGKNVDISI